MFCDSLRRILSSTFNFLSNSFLVLMKCFYDMHVYPAYCSIRGQDKAPALNCKKVNLKLHFFLQRMSLYCFSNKIVPPAQKLSGNFQRNRRFRGEFTFSALSVPFGNSPPKIKPKEIKLLKARLLQQFH